ncbi:uncharacterized protein V6R79_021809 [Siganus canaliculatus]
MENSEVCAVPDDYEWFPLPMAYSLVFPLGLCLNGALLWCVCYRTRSWTGPVIYMTNLAVVDLLYVLTLPPLIISNILCGLWPFGDIICKAVRFFFFVNLHCSMMFLTCISVDRFLGVCFPIAAVRLRTKRSAIFASGSVWILAIVEIFPTLVFVRTGVLNNETVCFEMTEPSEFRVYFPYGLFLAIVGFLIPFTVAITCYCSIIKVLYCKSADIICHARTSRMRNKSLRTLLTVCLMFVVCFVPYHITRTFYLFVNVYMPEDCPLIKSSILYFKICKSVVSFNCCANPLLYFWGSGELRQKLRAWLRRRVSTVQPLVVDAGSTNRSGG